MITTLVVSASQDRLLLSFRNMSTMALGLALIVLLFRSQKFLNWLGWKIRSGLRKTTVLAETDVTEILRQAEGYCVTRLHVAGTSPLIDKTIASSGLRARDILVLSIERAGHLIPLPTAERVILHNDGLICYGPIATIRKLSQISSKPQPST